MGESNASKAGCEAWRKKVTEEGKEDMTMNTKADLLGKQHKQDAWVSRVLQALLVLWYQAFSCLLYLQVCSYAM